MLKKNGAKRTLLLRGAGDRGRTGTMLPSRDFKSRASANSATPARAAIVLTPQYIILHWRKKVKKKVGVKHVITILI